MNYDEEVKNSAAFRSMTGKSRLTLILSSRRTRNMPALCARGLFLRVSESTG
ncbi:MAG: hypothetical protein ACLUSP_08755 [Christensenellales bacterium]